MGREVQRLFDYGVAFLLDAADVHDASQKTPGSDALARIERNLAAAAAFLRACHELAGQKDNDGPMFQFVRLARNAHFHAGRLPQSLGAVSTTVTFTMGTTPEEDRASFDMIGGRFQMDIEDAVKGLWSAKPELVAKARNYYNENGQDVFVCLRAAAHETSQLLGLNPTALNGLDGRRLDQLRVVIETRDTKATRAWLMPHLDEGADEADGLSRMSRPAPFDGLPPADK